jgi:hypothetical protein
VQVLEIFICCTCNISQLPYGRRYIYHSIHLFQQVSISI